MSLFFLALWGCGSLEVRIEPADPVYGRDALTCVAEGAIEWSSGSTTHAGAVLPVEVARTQSEWTCRAIEGRREGVAQVTPRVQGGNVLIFLLDDIGVDRIGSYASHPNPVATPVIDSLAAGGTRFERAWATPVCSPTRATLMTGRLPNRMGLGRIIDSQAPEHILREEEVCLPELLASAPAPYTSSMVGKWHLAGRLIDEVDHPARACGFSHHAGPVENLQAAITVPPPRGYFRWEENTNGVLEEVEGYATAAQVEGAVEQLGTLPEPWMLYVPFSGAHIPLHTPPDDFVYTAPGDSDAALHRAMVESIDIAIGRVVDALPAEVRARTTIFVIGDNGTRLDLPDPPLANGKGSVHEAGIQVPFIVNGPVVAVPGSVATTPVNTTDVFETLADLAGVDLGDFDGAWAAAHPRDSVSFLPALGDPTARLRSVNYSEWFEPNGPGPYVGYQRAVTDGRYKLMTWEGEPVPEPVRFYDLWVDPTEASNLVDAVRTEEEEAAWVRLMAALEAWEPAYDLE